MGIGELNELIAQMREAGRQYAATTEGALTDHRIKVAANAAVRTIPVNNRVGYTKRLIDEFTLSAKYIAATQRSTK